MQNIYSSLVFIMLMYPPTMFIFKQLYTSLHNKHIYRIHLAVSTVLFVAGTIAYLNGFFLKGSNLDFTFATPLLFLILHKLLNLIAQHSMGRNFIVTNKYDAPEKGTSLNFDLVATLACMLIPVLAPPAVYELINSINN